MLKTFIMLQKISISNKCGYFELSFNQRILKKKIYDSFQKIWSRKSVFNIDKKNVFDQIIILE